jgi:hypothetical protein
MRNVSASRARLSAVVLAAAALIVLDACTVDNRYVDPPGKAQQHLAPPYPAYAPHYPM